MINYNQSQIINEYQSMKANIPSGKEIFFITHQSSKSKNQQNRYCKELIGQQLVLLRSSHSPKHNSKTYKTNTGQSLNCGR